VPSTEAGDPAVVYDYFEYQVMGGQQSDHDSAVSPTGPNCMMATRYSEVSAGVFGVSYSTHFAGQDCTTAASLKTHAADVGTSPWFDYWKPPGIKWTVTRFDCAFVEPTPGSGSQEDEKLDFYIGFRTAAAATTVSLQRVVLDSDEDAGVWVSNTAIDQEIATAAEAASMVMLFEVDDDDAADPGAASFTNINVKCIVTVKVE
jgi:hypothetical protein